MYDELVKRLREYGKEHCPLDRGSGICGCIDAREAADAIEALNDTSQAQDKALKNIAGQLARRWIPVTERLPEKSEHYLVHINCGQDGKIMSSWTQVAWFCKKFYWEHLHGEAFEETITHWMPLPQPPKEE